jgi:spore coat polysaccharide biosynthesis predicted glycosyltransferase SpsG
LNILIRTSGGPALGRQLGLGHVYRCINLAQHFIKHNIIFLIEDFGGVKLLLEKKGFTNIFVLRKNIDVKSDIVKTKKIIEFEQIDLAIIDFYNVKKRYLNAISKKTKTVLITDLWNYDYPVHLVINGFVGFKNQDIINNYGAKCLLGPKYQILNKNFAKQCPPTGKKFDLLITFGGTDEKNIASKIIPLIQKYDSIKTQLIVNQSNFKKLSKTIYKNIKITTNVKNMHKAIQLAKCGLCTGGLTTYEFVSTGVPFAVICDEKHQLITAKEWEKRKMAINLGLFANHSMYKIEKLLLMIKQNKLNLVTNNKIVDGNGSKRIFCHILKM